MARVDCPRTVGQSKDLVKPPTFLCWATTCHSLKWPIYVFLTGTTRLLITDPEGLVGDYRRHDGKPEERTMMDLIYVGVVVLFFLISGLYAHLCEKM